MYIFYFLFGQLCSVLHEVNNTTINCARYEEMSQASLTQSTGDVYSGNINRGPVNLVSTIKNESQGHKH